MAEPTSTNAAALAAARSMEEATAAPTRLRTLSLPAWPPLPLASRRRGGGGSSLCGGAAAPGPSPRGGRVSRSLLFPILSVVALSVLLAGSWLHAAFVGSPGGRAASASPRTPSLRPSPQRCALATDTLVETKAEKLEASSLREDSAPLRELPPNDPTVQDPDSFRMLTLSLLQRVDRVQDMVDGGDLGSDERLTREDLVDALKRLELDCTDHEAHTLFSMLDTERKGAFEVGELRSRLRSSQTVSDIYSESLRNVSSVLLLTCGVCIGIFLLKGASSGLDFVTCYIVEDSLSVDNLFVFLLLFRYFKVPPSLQSFALNLGVYGAMVLRAVCIFAGVQAVQQFRPLLLLFSAFLIYSSFTSLWAMNGEEDDEEESEEPPELVQGVLGRLPTTSKFEGEKLVVEHPKTGAWLATPLALCIIAVELSDIIFAVDSIPAVLAVTSDPLIVYTSNIAAILGLRSMYQVLAVAVSDLVYLDKAVAVVLGFVGLKLAAEVAGLEISSMVSLGVITLTLAAGVGLSLAKQR